jgi:hypothetical protein
MSKALDKRKIDVSQAFLVYMACVGDCDRVAAAIDLEPAQVKALAEEEGWSDKVRRISVISRNGRPGDFERAQSRALNFVQAHCIRLQINRLLREISSMTDEELVSRACVRTRDGGQQLSGKVFVDLAAAAEACHRMTYMSLGDTVTERLDNPGGGGAKGSNSNDLHAAIIASLSNPADKPEAATKLLVEEADAEVRRLASEVLPAEAPASHVERQLLPVDESEARAEVSRVDSALGGE